MSDDDKSSIPSTHFATVFNKNTDPNLLPIHLPFTITYYFSSFPISEIILKFLTSFPSKFNNSSDGIPKDLLKLLANEYKFPMSLLFNTILESGICPDIWTKKPI